MEETREAKNLGLCIAQNTNKVKGLEGAGVTPGALTSTSLWGNVSKKRVIITIIIVIIILFVIKSVVIAHPSNLPFNLEKGRLALPGCFSIFQGF